MGGFISSVLTFAPICILTEFRKIKRCGKKRRKKERKHEFVFCIVIILTGYGVCVVSSVLHLEVSVLSGNLPETENVFELVSVTGR
jgi:hypothetical protein